MVGAGGVVGGERVEAEVGRARGKARGAVDRRFPHAADLSAGGKMEENAPPLKRRATGFATVDCWQKDGRGGGDRTKSDVENA